jgi:hypothetical protein
MIGLALAFVVLGPKRMHLMLRHAGRAKGRLDKATEGYENPMGGTTQGREKSCAPRHRGTGLIAWSGDESFRLCPRSCCGRSRLGAERRLQSFGKRGSARPEMSEMERSFPRKAFCQGLIAIRCEKELSNCVFGTNRTPATRIFFLSVTSANPATIRIDNPELRNLKTSAVHEKYSKPACHSSQTR